MTLDDQNTAIPAENTSTTTEAVDNQTTAAPSPEPTIDDTLAKTMAEIRARESGQERGEDGKFKPKANDGETAPNVAKEETTDKTEDAPTPKQAPSSWRANVRDTFNTLPPEVQDEVLRREADFHKGIEVYKQDADYGRGLKQVLSPYAQDFQQFGVTEAQAVQNLLQTERSLRLGTPEQKLQIVSGLIQSYGIPIEALLNDDGQVPESSRQVAHMATKIAQLEQQLHGFTATQQQAQDSEINTLITKFASDPANKYFEDVKQDMGRLMNSGMATDLKDAYEKATWARPDIRQAILTQQQNEAEAKRQKEAHEKVVKAQKAAGMNLRTQGAIPTASTGPKTMDETLRETFRRIHNQ